MNNPVYWVGLFLFYFANYFVIVFFNSALIAIVQAAVYMYGSSGTAPAGFESAALRSAFARS